MSVTVVLPAQLRDLAEGREDIRWSGGLATPLPEGSEVVILPSVSGG